MVQIIRRTSSRSIDDRAFWPEGRFFWTFNSCLGRRSKKTKPRKLMTLKVSKTFLRSSCKKENPDIKLVLTDYNMPEMNGFDLTLDLRKHHLKEQLAVIGLSATGNNELGAQFIKNGANDFLTKPVSYEELLCRINQNIDMLFYMEALRNAAHRDFLTNLYNRRYFFNEGKVLYEKSIQNHQPVAVAMLDIDHFKQVNDNYGHEVGDDLLVYFSYELSKQFDQHIVARLGGEEFVVLFTNVESEQAFDLMDKFRQKIADASIKTDGETISMSVSIGLHHIAGESLDAMLKLADENLYRAKNNGRNRVVSS